VLCLQRKVGPLPVLLAPQNRRGSESSPADGVIDLGGCRLGDNMVAALAEALRMREEPLSAMLLRDNQLHGLPGALQSHSAADGSGLNTSGVLDQQPRQSKHLGPGELRRHATPSGLRPSIVAVGDVIRMHELTLARLDLSENPLGPSGAVLVAQALDGNVVLQDLHLRSCGLKDRGVAVLAEVLLNCISLRTLDLYGNELGPSSGDAVAEILKTSIGLQELDVSWNPLRAGGERVLGALKDNMSGLRTLNMAWTGVRDANGAQRRHPKLRPIRNAHSSLLDHPGSPMDHCGSPGVSQAQRGGRLAGGAVAHALHHAQRLQVLDLSHNEIGEKAAMVGVCSAACTGGVCTWGSCVCDRLYWLYCACASRYTGIPTGSHLPAHCESLARTEGDCGRSQADQVSGSHHSFQQPHRPSGRQVHPRPILHCLALPCAALRHRL
jgi:hypothetical protein